MRILYAASEANPFAKSGGLADVAGALPKALVKDGVDARVIMPLYGDLKHREMLEYVTNYSVPVGWRSQYSGLFKAESLSHPVVPLTETSVFFTLEPWLPWAGLALFLICFAPALLRFRRHI